MQLDEHEGVALRIAEPAQRRHRVAVPADLGVDVDARFLELGVQRVDVGGLQADSGLGVAGGRRAFRRRRKRDGRVGAGRRDLDPAVARTERLIGALLHAERADVEVERLVLVGHGDDDVGDLADAGGRGAHDSLLGLLTSLRPAGAGKLIGG